MEEAPRFELERVRVTDSQVVITGAWYGVRGRRFIRPSLTAAGSERVLADLEHKPWAAENGEPWVAAFERADALSNADELELAVAPDIAVMIPVGRSSSGRRGSTAASKRERRRTKAGLDAIGADLTASPASTASPAPTTSPAPTASPAPTTSPAQRDELARAIVARDEARRERDAASAALTSMTGRLDAARAERDQAEAGRQELHEALQAAMAERDAANEQRDRLSARLRSLTNEHEQTLARLTREHGEELARIQRDNDQVGSGARRQHEALVDTMRAEHERAVKQVLSDHDKAVRSLQASHEHTIKAQREESDRTIADLTVSRDRAETRAEKLQEQLRVLEEEAGRSGPAVAALQQQLAALTEDLAHAHEFRRQPIVLPERSPSRATITDAQRIAVVGALLAGALVLLLIITGS